jgi:hypothetical protein
LKIKYILLIRFGLFNAGMVLVFVLRHSATCFLKEGMRAIFIDLNEAKSRIKLYQLIYHLKGHLVELLVLVIISLAEFSWV